MGIHGLTGFIDKNQHLLHQHELHDCCVVLDGNNFYHFIYYACHVQFIFGGDYDIYRKKIISTFESFRACGIVPYIVMDGAYTVDSRKLKTSLSRALSRIKLIDTMANNQKGQALPALAYETFMQTLNELGVHHATCQFEADNEIAVLANKLKCPVISNDSDFFIFDLTCGFLPLDYLDFRPLKKVNADGTHAYTFLHCHKYSVDDFINSFEGLNRSVLPVFASLLGNDFINVSAFSSFFSRIKVPKVVSKKFSLPPRLSKVISVLHWLHTHNNSTDFLNIKDELLSSIKPARREKVEQLFISSVNGYTDVENFQGFDLFKFFTLPKEKCILTATPEFSGFNGTVFPMWFIEGVCLGEVTPSILNSAILHRIIILTQIEDLTLPSSYLCSTHLRQVLYGILLQGDQPAHHRASCSKESSETSAENASNTHNEIIIPTESNLEVIENNELSDLEMKAGHTDSGRGISDLVDGLIYDDEEKDIVECSERIDEDAARSNEQVRQKQICIEEYTRLIKNLKKTTVQPVYSVEEMSLPNLQEITSLSLEDRRKILLRATNNDQSFIDKFSEDLQLFIIGLIWWALHADPKVTQRHLETVILGILLIKAIDILSENKNNCKNCSISHCERCDQTLYNKEGNLSCETKMNIHQVCLQASKAELERLQQNLDRYHKKAPIFNCKNFFNPAITHAFSQLQAVIVDLINLNKVLRFPFLSCRPADLLNGTFLYNFQTQFLFRPDPDLFVASMLGRGSALHKLFQNVVTVILEFVGQDTFPSLSVTAKKIRKKKLKRTNCERSSADVRALDSDHVEPTVVPGFDVSNRFSVLSVS